MADKNEDTGRQVDTGNFNLPRPNLTNAPVQTPHGREGTEIDAAVFNLPPPIGINLFGKGSS